MFKTDPSEDAVVVGRGGVDVMLMEELDDVTTFTYHFDPPRGLASVFL